MFICNRLSCISILITALLLSCSEAPIKRNSSGVPESEQQGRVFAGHVKKKIALLPLFNEAPVGGEDLALIATEELRMELSRTGGFVLDNVGNQIFGSSKEVYSGGGVKLAQLSRKAKIVGLNFVVFGRVLDARVREKSDEIGLIRKTTSACEAKIELRIFDVNASKEIYTEVLDGYADDNTYRFFNAEKEEYLSYRQELLRYAARVAVRKTVPEIIAISKKMEWTGRVARIVGNKIYLNAGRDSGLNVGDILRVITEGVEVFDPETGALIGVSKGDVKGTIEVIDYLGTDGSIAILHSGGSVVEGDFVQLY